MKAIPPLILCALLAPVSARPASPPCLGAEESAARIGQELCLAAHVYNVVELDDGARILDLCPPEQPDSACRIAILAPAQSQRTLGDLSSLRGQDVRLRGLVRATHDRAVIYLTDRRQLHGEPPRFQPNPALEKAIAADDSRSPIHDPNLRSQGGRSASLNNHNQSLRPAKE